MKTKAFDGYIDVIEPSGEVYLQLVRDPDDGHRYELKLTLDDFPGANPYENECVHVWTSRQGRYLGLRRPRFTVAPSMVRRAKWQAERWLTALGL